MGVLFVEGRGLPTELRGGGGYSAYAGNELDQVANIFRAVSPWDMLTGIFVTKPAAERQAQVDLTRIQADSLAKSQAQRAQTTKSVVLYAVGGVTVLVLALVMLKRRKAPSVAGYRRRRSRR